MVNQILGSGAFVFGSWTRDVVTSGMPINELGFYFDKLTMDSMVLYGRLI